MGSILRMALADAERWGNVQRNAAALVPSPRRKATRLDDALDIEEAAMVIEAARGDRLEALAVLVLSTGLRQGEALRLRWGDIDLTHATLMVTRSKTPSGARTIALPGFVVSALRAHRARQREERMAAVLWADPSLAFTTLLGEPIPRRNALRWWHGLCERARVRRRRFHASRPTAATLMLNNGVPLEVVSKTLGHAGLAITADVYATVRPELQRTAADAMERVLGWRCSNPPGLSLNRVMTTDAAWEYHPEVHGHRCIECDGLAVWLYVDRSLDGPLVGRDRYCQACATDRFMAE